MEHLEQYGWTNDFTEKWEVFSDPSLRPARVVADFGTSLRIALPDIKPAELSGKLAHHSNRDEVPKVGDWVAARVLDNSPAVIETIIPRRSEIARKVAGLRTVKQTIAANVDIAFVLLALDNDFSVERLQRFLYQISINHIQPVIVLNKADKTDDLQSFIKQLSDLDIPIFVSTAKSGIGVDEIRNYITAGKTAILLGSSGVGKSTLTNQLLGRDIQRVQDIRYSDETGKHTTVHRELFVLPNGGMLIDTPGIREIQLWGTQENLDDKYDDIASLIKRCAYSNCQHNGEAGCAVQASLQDGSLSKRHYDNYVKMKSELAGLKERSGVRMRKNNKKPQRDNDRRHRDAMNDIREETR